MMNKKADFVTENVVYLTLNLMLFLALIYFIVTIAEGKNIYEQVYAKQIALLIDSSKPGITFSLNIQEIMKFVKNPEKAFIIDSSNKKVTVNLGSLKGYSFNFFTDAKISYSFQKIKQDSSIQNFLVVKLEEKNEQ